MTRPGDTMRAVRLHAFGPPESLRVESVPLPSPDRGEVRVRVACVGLNFADTERRRGLYLAGAPLPETLGFEGSGVVDAVGTGAPASLLGQRVAFLSPGACAEYALVLQERLMPLPGAVDDVRGAAFPVQGLTAFHLVHTCARVLPGETCLVTSAAGGVGGLLSQLLRQRGARAVGLVSSEAKVARAAKRGAEAVVVRRDDWAATVRAASGGGVDVVFDGLGRALDTEGLAVLRAGGRWWRYGESTGAPTTPGHDALTQKNVSVGGYWLRGAHPLGAWERGVAEVTAAVASGALALDVSVADGLEAVAEVHRRLESGESLGKWVVRVTPRAAG